MNSPTRACRSSLDAASTAASSHSLEIDRAFETPWSRREFLGALATSAVGLSLGTAQAADMDAGPRFPLIGFTKPFQKFTAEETAELVATVGWDGVELPLRAKGQIEPERTADELPRFAEALQRQKRRIHLLATDITSLKTPHAETILRTMARLGIKRLRLGHIQYPSDQPPAAFVKSLAPALKDITDACRDLGLQAGFQNHSGARYVGASVWDVHSILQTLNPRHIGYCFDIGHATIEGGLSWPTEARLAEPFLTAVFVKDFAWKKAGDDWKETWCPLGEGMVRRRFFTWLKTTSYRGPICQHHEFNLGEGPQRLANLQRDLKVLKEWLA